MNRFKFRRLKYRINNYIRILIPSSRNRKKIIYWFINKFPFLLYLNKELRTIRHSGLFDIDWYYNTYPDIAVANMHPMVHYLLYGYREGRNPSPLFDSVWYLRYYPEVDEAGINPLIHYIRWGKQEGKQPTFSKTEQNNYSEWIRRYDSLNDMIRMNMKKHIEAMQHKPLVSIVMATFNPHPNLIEETIESVLNQIYPHWELCIADDTSTDTSIHGILQKYAEGDSRIKFVTRQVHGQIAEASNSALQIAAGDWIGFLDQEDRLAEHALFWIAETINANPHSRLIFSDEDKIDSHGNRKQPYFKCDWNQDLFYSHNMIHHLSVYDAELVKKSGGFRPGFEGAHHYDMALRCIEMIKPDQIIHIPRILYHGRNHSEKGDPENEINKLAFIAGGKALNEHVQRKGIAGWIERADDETYRIQYTLPEPAPLVSIIILTKNALPLIRTCIQSIFAKTVYSNYEFIIVDNGSDDPEAVRYLHDLQSDSRIRYIRDGRPFNYSALNNNSVKIASGEYIALLNNDIEVISPDWLNEMVSIASQPGIGAVGCRLWYPDNTLQHGGIILGINGVAGHAFSKLPRGEPGYFRRAERMQSLSAVTAACLVIKKETYEHLEGLNEKQFAVAFNDVDFCLRLKEAGFRTVWTPYVELYHHESATRGRHDTPEKLKQFTKEAAFLNRRWGDLLLNDPAYNPNLTLDSCDFTLAWPPRINKKYSNFITRGCTYNDVSNPSNQGNIPFYTDDAAHLYEIISRSRMNITASVDGDAKEFSLIILNKNSPQLIIPLLDCLIGNNLNRMYEIIVGDTGSEDERVIEYYREHSDKITIVRNLSYHFSRNYNYLISNYAHGEIVGIMNNDIILHDVRFLDKIKDAMKEKTTGVVGYKLLYPDGRLQHGGVYFRKSNPNQFFPYHRLHGAGPGSLPDCQKETVPAVTGSFLFCRREEYLTLGGMDEHYEEEAQDIDLCLKFQRIGQGCIFINSDRIVHVENGTREKGSENRNDREYFLWKWKSYIAAAILDSELNHEKIH